MLEEHMPNPPREPNPAETAALPYAHEPHPDGTFDATLVTFAAMSLFDSLTADQRSRLILPFATPAREHWNFLPESGRPGIAFGELDRHQRTLAHRLLAESTSVGAYARAVQVMANELVLRELNQAQFGHVAVAFRDPGAYFLTMFGQPQPDTTWGWRLVGHHLSLNITVVAGDLLSVTPFLLGSEPARFGPFRILGEEEDAGFALLNCLDDELRRRAVIHDRPPADFVTRTVRQLGEIEFPGHHGVGRRDAAIDDADRRALAYMRAHPRGVPGRDLPPPARNRFSELLACFVLRARPASADHELDRIEKAGGLDALHFAWAGGLRPDQPHYFRIQGPVTLIEFDNAEDNANHTHSLWRDPTNDFGRDLLLEHHRTSHALPPPDEAEPRPLDSGD
jgi:hypothetical protein